MVDVQLCRLLDIGRDERGGVGAGVEYVSSGVILLRSTTHATGFDIVLIRNFCVGVKRCLLLRWDISSSQS